MRGAALLCPSRLPNFFDTFASKAASVMGGAFFVGTYNREVRSRVRGVIVMDKTAFFTMPSGLYVVSAAADGLRDQHSSAGDVRAATHLGCREQG